jgi:hypothetical protein
MTPPLTSPVRIPKYKYRVGFLIMSREKSLPGAMIHAIRENHLDCGEEISGISTLENGCVIAPGKHGRLSLNCFCYINPLQ